MRSLCFVLFLSYSGFALATPEARVLFGAPAITNKSRFLIKNMRTGPVYIKDPSQIRFNNDLVRDWSWQILSRVFAPTELRWQVGNTPHSENIPAWLTWYESWEGAFVFTQLFPDWYRKHPQERLDLKNVLQGFANLPAKYKVDPQWSNERYQNLLSRLSTRESVWGFKGVPRVLMNPQAVSHILANHPEAIECVERQFAIPLDEEGRSPSNFSNCLSAEFPPESIIVKAEWRRLDDSPTFPVFATDPEAFAQMHRSDFEWLPKMLSPFPDRKNIFTIKVPTGQIYQLVGFHIMAKALREWLWITLWWSDNPAGDWGFDRPRFVGGSSFPIQDYKMCAVTHFHKSEEPKALTEGPPTPLSEVQKAVEAMNQGYTWCSNPYLELGKFNSRTNCMGCHQHGGSNQPVENILSHSELGSGFAKVRKSFPSDYFWSFNQGKVQIPLEMKTVVDYFQTQSTLETSLDLPAPAPEGSMKSAFDFWKQSQ